MSLRRERPTGEKVPQQRMRASRKTPPGALLNGVISWSPPGLLTLNDKNQVHLRIMHQLLRHGSRRLHWSSPVYYPDQHHDDGDDEQCVNDSAHRVATYQSQQPQNQ